jgi:hypothetical protein
MDVKNAHFVFVISGRTKGDQTSGAKFGVLVAGKVLIFEQDVG